MKYNSEFIDEATKEYSETIKGDPISRYAIQIDPDFGSPPPMEMIRFMSDLGNADRQESITRFCILKKKVSIFLDGTFISDFQMNNLTDSWEAFTVLTDHPIAFSLLMNLCQSFVIKKYSLPPIKETDPVVAKTQS